MKGIRPVKHVGNPTCLLQEFWPAREDAKDDWRLRIKGANGQADLENGSWCLYFDCIFHI